MTVIAIGRHWRRTNASRPAQARPHRLAGFHPFICLLKQVYQRLERSIFGIPLATPQSARPPRELLNCSFLFTAWLQDSRSQRRWKQRVTHRIERERACNLHEAAGTENQQPGTRL